MGAIQDRLLSELAVKDDLAFKLGDTLDVKASIGLVVITFLGTQTAYLLDKHVQGTSHVLQSGSVIALVVATVCTLVELWPRQYTMVQPETNVTDRVAELTSHYSPYPDAEASILAQLTTDEIDRARKRIEINQGKNSIKASWLATSFYATAASVALNLITVVLVWFTHPF